MAGGVEMKNFVCPMHPEVHGFKNDKCPKCGMDLVPAKTSLKKLAFSSTLHCLTGCAIGEVLGMALGAYFGRPDIETIIISVALAFFFGYSLTLIPLLKSAMSLSKALPLAFASDTLSITIMEIIDNLIMFIIPGAMSAPLNSVFFWGSLAFSLVLAFLAAWPVNMYLISKGSGHAVVHTRH
jgi:hypothetical protein